MRAYYEGDGITIYHGDCREVLEGLTAASASAVITDPPYGVDKRGEMIGQIAANYHGKGTHTRGYADHDSQKFAELIRPFAAQARRVVAPGRHVGVFGATRTMWEVAAHITEAGLMMMDTVAFEGGGRSRSRGRCWYPRGSRCY